VSAACLTRSRDASDGASIYPAKLFRSLHTLLIARLMYGRNYRKHLSNYKSHFRIIFDEPGQLGESADDDNDFFDHLGHHKIGWKFFQIIFSKCYLKVYIGSEVILLTQPGIIQKIILMKTAFSDIQSRDDRCVSW
jgi:hypothetical protein